MFLSVCVLNCFFFFAFNEFKLFFVFVKVLSNQSSGGWVGGWVGQSLKNFIIRVSFLIAFHQANRLDFYPV